MWLGGANLVLAIFNMVPALPLDGGRVLRALLAKKRGLYQGTRRAVQVNRVFSLALAAFALWTFSPWLVVMAVMVWMMGTAELRQAEQHALLTEIQDWYPVRSPWAGYDDAARRERMAPTTASRGVRPLEPDAIIVPYRG
jgi:Peptidase family M50